jgi:nucleoid-associated protein YgaU
VPPPEPASQLVTVEPEPASVEAPPAAPVGDVYVVRPGDTLWTIAERRLGPEASPLEIARFVDRLWSVNAAAIGTGSPDMIMPGQHLRVPEAG